MKYDTASRFPSGQRHTYLSDRNQMKVFLIVTKALILSDKTRTIIFSKLVQVAYLPWLYSTIHTCDTMPLHGLCGSITPVGENSICAGYQVIWSKDLASYTMTMICLATTRKNTHWNFWVLCPGGQPVFSEKIDVINKPASDFLLLGCIPTEHKPMHRLD